MARTPTKDLFPNLAIGAMALVVKPDLADFFRKVGHAPTHSLNFKAPFFLKTAVILAGIRSCLFRKSPSARVRKLGKTKPTNAKNTPKTELPKVM